MPDRLPNCHRPKYKIAKYVVKILFSPILDFLINALKYIISNNNNLLRLLLKFYYGFLPQQIFRIESIFLLFCHYQTFLEHHIYSMLPSSRWMKSNSCHPFPY